MSDGRAGLRPLDRRSFLRAGVGVVGTAMLAGCRNSGGSGALSRTTQGAPAETSQSSVAPSSTGPTPSIPAGQIVPLGSIEGFSLVLGRPTDRSIAASLLSDIDRQVAVHYGPQSSDPTSLAVTLAANQPQHVELGPLQADTVYRYMLSIDDAVSDTHGFHTQRSAGSTFVFTMDADPHNRDPRFNGELYATTLANALSDGPDLHLNLGDTFMTEKARPAGFAEAEATFVEMRPYLGRLCADVPLMLVNGNHEGELGWLLPGGDQRQVPIWSTQLRQAYYPSPALGDFFTGGSTPDLYLGGVRDGYYAWMWGDALFAVLDPFWYTSDKPKAASVEDNWNWTLGREQYDWLRSTLENSRARHKLLFIHHLVGGGAEARGGVEVARSFEWGGNNADGSYGFDAHRPGWGKPLHQLCIDTGVGAVFHGHDHVFVHQQLDGIVYQELPQSSNAQKDNTHLAADYGYVEGDVVGGSGHLRATVTPDAVAVEFVRAVLAADASPARRNGEIAYRYTIPARR